jgi:transcriptional regulator with XRE-family HTH domain
MKTENYELLQAEILLAVRGRLSQVQLSRKLGLSSNKVHRWESQLAPMSWLEFCDLCEVLKLGLKDACRTVLAYDGKPTDVRALTAHLLGKTQNAELAKRFGVSASMISRWRSGKITPSLAQILHFIDNSFFSLPQFIGKIISIKKVPSLHARLEIEKEERNLHVEYPWIAALLLYMRTVEYNRLAKHEVSFLAKRLGINVERVSEVFEKLKLINAVAKEDGREIFVPTHRTLNTAGDPEGNRRVREYWTSRCLEAIKNRLPTPERNSWGYMVLNTSPETYQQIRERYLQFYQDIHQIVANSTSATDSVYLLNVQVLNLKDLEPVS